jgi:2-(1,2-epoxy-1,2-dihydrophenyl)acetyl-CoA isomerase
MSEDYENIRYALADGVATITLNRPEKLNAYVPEMGDEVVAAFRHARTSQDVRVVILTGAGRGFCAGVDLEALKASFSAQTAAQGRKLGEEDFVRKLPLELWEFPKPVIAAINGHAIGVGITMTLACDIRLAAEDAKIGLTFAKLGILPGLGSTSLLPRLVGMAKAQELVLTAKLILGSEAAEIGLVNRAVPADQLLEQARELALSMAAHDPDVLAAAKRSLHEGASLSLADAMENERERAGELRSLRARKRD